MTTISSLTARENQILDLMAQGFNAKEVAFKLGLQPGTVKVYLAHLYRRERFRNGFQAVAVYVEARTLKRLPEIMAGAHRGTF